MSPALIVGLIVLTGASGFAAALIRRRRRRREEARSLATELVPEIRSVMGSCDPGSPSRGEPLPGDRFAHVRQKLPVVFSGDALFAVETFYQCVDAYAEASREMTEAFSDGSGLSLGDRIRAKDRRDRCLKDVYYTGEGALERLQKMS